MFKLWGTDDHSKLIPCKVQLNMLKCLGNIPYICSQFKSYCWQNFAAVMLVKVLCLKPNGVSLRRFKSQ